MRSWREIVFQPLSLGNLFLRTGILFYVLYQGHWFLGDSAHYLNFSQEVCSGEWGGEPVKGPFYLWYLCALMPKIHYITGTGILSMTLKEMAPYVWIPLAVQNLLVWLAGLLIFRITGIKWLMAFWLFDPVNLAYSNLLMPDILFSLLLLMAMVCLFQMLSDETKQTAGHSALTAFFLTAATLCRSNGLVIHATVLAWFFFLLLKKRVRKKTFAMIFICSVLFLAPRLYWNHSRHGVFSLATQGDTWLQSVSGVVENYGKGLDFYQSEQKWFQDHPNPGRTDVYQSLSSNWKSFVQLSIKGALRVLFGHANIEWFQIIKGYAPLGPGWFRPTEHRAGNKVENVEMMFWVIGLFLCTTFAITAYLVLLKSMIRLKTVDSWHALSVLVVMMVAVMPLVYGEARFRLGLWPFVLMCIAWTRLRLVNPVAIKKNPVFIGI